MCIHTYTRAYPRRGLSRMINDGAETTAGVGRVIPAEPELFLIRCRSSLPTRRFSRLSRVERATHKSAAALDHRNATCHELRNDRLWAPRLNWKQITFVPTRGSLPRGCRTGKLERLVASDPRLTATTARNLKRRAQRFIVEHRSEISPHWIDRWMDRWVTRKRKREIQLFKLKRWLIMYTSSIYIK